MDYNSLPSKGSTLMKLNLEDITGKGDVIEFSEADYPHTGNLVSSNRVGHLQIYLILFIFLDTDDSELDHDNLIEHTTNEGQRKRKRVEETTRKRKKKKLLAATLLADDDKPNTGGSLMYFGLNGCILGDSPGLLYKHATL